MKKFTALALVAGLSATGASAQYDLVYNAADGTLTIQNTGGIRSFVIISDSNAFNAGAFTGVLGALPTSETFEVSEANPFQANNTAELSLGAVLPTDMDAAGFNAAISSATYVADLGGAETAFNLVYVPEPTSLALLGLGGLLVARRRRSA